jgi:hypothetical protein
MDLEHHLQSIVMIRDMEVFTLKAEIARMNSDRKYYFTTGSLSESIEKV